MTKVIICERVKKRLGNSGRYHDLNIDSTPADWTCKVSFDTEAKRILYIGIGHEDDICVDPELDPDLEPRHIQLIWLNSITAKPKGRLRQNSTLSEQPEKNLRGVEVAYLVNFGKSDIIVQRMAMSTNIDQSKDIQSYIQLARHQRTSLAYGDWVRLGRYEFSIYAPSDLQSTKGALSSKSAPTFDISTERHAPAPAVSTTSTHIGVSMNNLPGNVLEKDKPIYGELKITNLGLTDGVFFRVRAEGITTESVFIENGPTLSSGAWAVCHFRIELPENLWKLPTGPQNVVFVIDTPDNDDYTAVRITQPIEVMPVSAHQLASTHLEKNS